MEFVVSALLIHSHALNTHNLSVKDARFCKRGNTKSFCQVVHTFNIKLKFAENSYLQFKSNAILVHHKGNLSP